MRDNSSGMHLPADSNRPPQIDVELWPVHGLSRPCEFLAVSFRACVNDRYPSK